MKQGANSLPLLLSLLLGTYLISPRVAFAHPGNTSSDGCHFCRTNCDSWGYTYNTRHGHHGEICDPSKGPIDPLYLWAGISTETPTPTQTPSPTLTPKPTFTPTPSPTAQPTSEVKALETEAPSPSPTEIRTPTPTNPPASTPTSSPMSAVQGTQTEIFGTIGFFFLAFFIGLPLWILYKYRGVIRERFFKKD